jgi:diguanylate cyclase (GGDEF)-like protein/PAS domain S-box-containing protein
MPYHLGLLALALFQNALTAVAYRATWQRVQRFLREGQQQEAQQLMWMAAPALATACWAGLWTMIAAGEVPVHLVLHVDVALTSWLILLGANVLMFHQRSRHMLDDELHDTVALGLNALYMLVLVYVTVVMQDGLMVVPPPKVPVVVLVAAGLSAVAASSITYKLYQHRMRGGLIVGGLLSIIEITMLCTSQWPAELFSTASDTATAMRTMVPIFSLLTAPAMLWLVVHEHLDERLQRKLAAPLPPTEPTPDEVHATSLSIAGAMLHERQTRDALYRKVLAESQVTFWVMDMVSDHLKLEGKVTVDEQVIDVSDETTFSNWTAEFTDRAEFPSLHEDIMVQLNSLGNFNAMHSLRLAPGSDRQRWIIARGTVTSWTPDRNPHHLVGTHVDITSYTELQKALELDGRLFSDGPVVMVRWLFDASEGRMQDMSFISVNAEQRWGYTLEEIQQESMWQKVFQPEGIQRMTDVLRSNLRRDIKDMSLEMQLKLRDGRLAWHTLFGRLEFADGRGILNGFLFDIDGFKMQEARLRDQAARLEDLLIELERAKAENAILRESSEFLNSAEDLHEAFDIVSRAAHAIFPEWSGALASAVSGEQLRLVGRWGEAMAFASDFQTADCWALRRGKTHAFHDERVNLRCRHVHSLDGSPRPHLCIPMLANGETIGSLHLMSADTQSREQMVQHAQRANRLGETLKLALSNLRLRAGLREQATHDGLTGLYNRGFMNERLPVEIQRSRREGARVALAMIDVDHFKRLNDDYGHEAGDTVLRAIGEVLLKHAKVYDLACRYGGEEVTLIMPGRSLVDALPVAEAIHSQIAGLMLEFNGSMLPRVTVSIGLADTLGGAADALLRRADEALYQAKREGRNRIVCSQPQQEEGSSEAPDTVSSSELMPHDG